MVTDHLTHYDFQEVVKKCSAATYPLYDQLLQGQAATKRITAKVNEAERRSVNQATVRALETRVEDWKGHHLPNFGELLLDDIFIVTKTDVDREYHVFLFEKIILCCKEVPPLDPKNPRSSKVGKSNSILKKQGQSAPPPMLNTSGKRAMKMTPLLLKGRIFLNNVTNANPNPKHSASLFLVCALFELLN